MCLILLITTVNLLSLADRDAPARGDQDVHSVIHRLKNQDPVVRREAVKALGLCSSCNPASVQALVLALRDDDRLVVLLAASALDRVNPGNSTSVPTVAGVLLERPVPAYARQLCLWGRQVFRPLGTGTIEPNTFKRLVQFQTDFASLHREAVFNRMLAAALLAGMGARAKRALPALRAALSDEDEGVRRAAAEALRTVQRACSIR